MRKAELDSLLTRAGELRTAEAQGAEPTYEGYVPDSGEGLEDAPPLFRQAYDYYRTPRDQYPRSENKCRCKASTGSLHLTGTPRSR